MEKSYIEKITAFISNMRDSNEGGEPSSFDVNPLYNGQEINDTTKFKINTDEATMLSVLENLTYPETSGEGPALVSLWTFDDYPGLYVIRGTVDTHYAYVIISEKEPEHGGLIYASDNIPFSDEFIAEKGYHNLDENDCYTFTNGERTITLGDQADKWNGIIVGTPKD